MKWLRRKPHLCPGCLKREAEQAAWKVERAERRQLMMDQLKEREATSRDFEEKIVIPGEWMTGPRVVREVVA